jgi:hypothetical protein
MVNVFPQPLLNDLIIGQGIPDGTIATNVATPGTVVLSNSATLTNPESIFQIGDVVDHILYDATTPWPNLPTDHVLLGLVYVPNSYTALSTPNTLRPWSVSDIWNSNNIENQTTKSLVNSYLSTIQEYSSDTTYMSGNTIIDPQTQSIARVIKNHYSSDLDASLNSGAIVKISSGGGSQDLEQVLTQGNSTGNLSITSPDGLTILDVADTTLNTQVTDATYQNLSYMTSSGYTRTVVDTINSKQSVFDTSYISSSLNYQTNDVSNSLSVDENAVNVVYNDVTNDIFASMFGNNSYVELNYINNTTGYQNRIQITEPELKLIYDNQAGALTYEFTLADDGFYLKNLPAYADDTAASAVPAGYLYQTDGSGAAPLNVPGIVMIKQ